jgi:diguanylate cyclase
LTELIISRIRRNHFLNAIISRDPLTGFWTENAFSEHFDTILGLTMRTRDALSAIVMDIDRFREINRCTGYMTGNSILKSIAACIFEHLRYSDIVGRYGSGRIAMALPGADLHAALEVARDLRRQIEAIKHVAGTSMFSVTVSMGLAGYRFDGMHGDIPFLVPQMVESANKALEVAKRRGSGSIEVYGPETDPELASPKEAAIITVP